MVLLFVESAVLSFLLPKLPTDAASGWLRIAFVSVAIAIAAIFWLFPVIKFLTNWLEITNTSVIVRSGTFGAKRQVSLRSIQHVQVVGRSKLVMQVVGEPDLEFAKLGKAKLVATELQKLIG
ncbi:MAG: hypothetical protein RL016_479 [Actinomycetota bacterium]